MLKIHFDSKKLDVPKSETYWAYDSIDLTQRPEYSRYVAERNELIVETTLKDADFVFVPYKWDGDREFVNSEVYKQALAVNKRVVAFFNDDLEGYIQNPNKNFYLFRTSTTKKTRKQNEIAMPAFSEEFIFQPPSQKAIKYQAISFCGNIQDPHRYPIFLEFEKQTNLAKNFIYRNGFWAPEIADKQVAKQQFLQNMLSGLFGLCIRGNGNFSYRLYETLALGRIPIIVNTDLQLPLAKSINWKNHAIILEKYEIYQIKHKLDQFTSSFDPTIVCESNKRLYDEYFSPCGLLKHFNLYLQESDV